MKPFELGAGATVNLDKLVDTRLLVQANSGGGKSWALRRILERTHGQVQQLVIDPEGEFSTLRERFDYVLAAREHGDTIADPRSARLLAERLLELGVSAILDIYELKAHERIRFVRGFLEALVDAPKKLWHPALVLVDEAHVYCPQAGEAESAGAVIDLATRGRKRGFCAVLATQRLSKLHKDAAAECNNKLIGRTGLDVDMKRAADELGLTSKEEIHRLRTLEPGEFFAFGPALAAGVQRIHVGKVDTTHPKAGARIAFNPPPPTAKVKALLPQLADLPAEAAERQKSLQELGQENAHLKRQLTLAKRGAPVVPAMVKEKTVEKRVEVPVLKDEQVKRLETVVAAIAGAGEKLATASGQLVTVSREILEGLRRIPTNGHHPSAPARPVHTSAMSRPAAAPDRPASPLHPKGEPTIHDSQPLSSAQQAILNAAGFLEGLGFQPPNVVQLALFAGQSATGGYWRANIGRLRTLGLIEGTALTPLGWEMSQPPAIHTADQLHRHVLDELLEGAQKPVLQVLLDVYPEALSAEELGSRAGFTPTGGYWRATIGRLRSLGLITKKGPIAALPVLFLEAAR